MPEAEFRAQWAGARKPAGDAELGDDPHAVMLARLSHELTSRCGYLELPEAKRRSGLGHSCRSRSSAGACGMLAVLGSIFDPVMELPPLDTSPPTPRRREETVKQADAIKAKRDALAADVAQKRSRLSALEAEVAKLRAAAQVGWGRGWVRVGVGAAPLLRPHYALVLGWRRSSAVRHYMPHQQL